jgi:hypothetical protein
VIGGTRSDRTDGMFSENDGFWLQRRIPARKLVYSDSLVSKVELGPWITRIKQGSFGIILMWTKSLVDITTKRIEEAALGAVDETVHKSLTCIGCCAQRMISDHFIDSVEQWWFLRWLLGSRQLPDMKRTNGRH